MNEKMSFQQTSFGEDFVLAQIALESFSVSRRNNSNSAHLGHIPFSQSFLMALINMCFQFVQGLELLVAYGADVILVDVVPFNVTHQGGMTAKGNTTLGAFKRRIARLMHDLMDGKVFLQVIRCIAMRAFESFLFRM